MIIEISDDKRKKLKEEIEHLQITIYDLKGWDLNKKYPTIDFIINQFIDD